MVAIEESIRLIFDEKIEITIYNPLEPDIFITNKYSTGEPISLDQLARFRRLLGDIENFLKFEIQLEEIGNESQKAMEEFLKEQGLENE